MKRQRHPDQKVETPKLRFLGSESPKLRFLIKSVTLIKKQRHPNLGF